jgi:hypothetical protein
MERMNQEPERQECSCDGFGQVKKNSAVRKLPEHSRLIRNILTMLITSTNQLSRVPQRQCILRQRTVTGVFAKVITKRSLTLTLRSHAMMDGNRAEACSTIVPNQSVAFRPFEWPLGIV